MQWPPCPPCARPAAKGSCTGAFPGQVLARAGRRACCGARCLAGLPHEDTPALPSPDMCVWPVRPLRRGSQASRRCWLVAADRGPGLPAMLHLQSHAGWPLPHCRRAVCRQLPVARLCVGGLGWSPLGTACPADAGLGRVALACCSLAWVCKASAAVSSGPQVCSLRGLCGLLPRGVQSGFWGHWGRWGW